MNDFVKFGLIILAVMFIMKFLNGEVEGLEEAEISEMLEQYNLTRQERMFIVLRLEGLTMEEISEDLEDSAYKLRQTVREKLLEGMFNEEKDSSWRDD